MKTHIDSGCNKANVYYRGILSDRIPLKQIS
jgi:hypothetical protein